MIVRQLNEAKYFDAIIIFPFVCKRLNDFVAVDESNSDIYSETARTRVYADAMECTGPSGYNLKLALNFPRTYSVQTRSMILQYAMRFYPTESSKILMTNRWFKMGDMDGISDGIIKYALYSGDTRFIQTSTKIKNIISLISSNADIRNELNSDICEAICYFVFNDNENAACDFCLIKEITNTINERCGLSSECNFNKKIMNIRSICECLKKL